MKLDAPVPINDVLAAPVDCEGAAGTLKDYLRELLATLWREEECFSGKRPFGNSGWQGDVYADLVQAGVLDGEPDEDGYPEFDYDDGEALVQRAIAAVFA